MGRLGAQDAEHVALARLDADAMAQQHHIPPTSKRKELDKAFFGDHPHHEANLVHVPGEHDARLRAFPFVAGDKAAHPVLLDGSNALQVLAHHGAHRLLVARHAAGLGDLF